MIRFIVPFHLFKNLVNLNIPANFEESFDNYNFFSPKKNLENLCRKRGERLQKSKGAATSKFQRSEMKRFLSSKFSIFVETEDAVLATRYNECSHAC